MWWLVFSALWSLGEYRSELTKYPPSECHRVLKKGPRTSECAFDILYSDTFATAIVLLWSCSDATPLLHHKWPPSPLHSRHCHCAIMLTHILVVTGCQLMLFVYSDGMQWSYYVMLPNPCSCCIMTPNPCSCCIMMPNPYPRWAMMPNPYPYCIMISTLCPCYIMMTTHVLVLSWWQPISLLYHDSNPCPCCIMKPNP